MAGVDDIEKNKSSVSDPKSKSDGPLGNPVFNDTVFHFGKVQDGEKVQHKFTFKNTGKGDLTVADVHASCGCTTPEWSKEIIPPGEEGFIVATFNSSGKGGPEGILTEKTVTVTFANSALESIVLKFRANVFSKPEQN
jgi:hypothetical protein